MIAVFCDEIRKRVLVDLNSLSAITGHDGRLNVSYQCICGRKGTMLTGRDRIDGGVSGHIEG